MFQQKKKRIEYLRSIWGKPLDRYRNIELIASYHNLLKEKSNEDYVDGKTWNDLDFSSIFSIMDRTISGAGQQYLYHLLHKYEGDERVLKQRYETIKLLKDSRELREEIQLKLFNMTGVSSYFISNLILNEDLPNTRHYPLFYLCSIFSAISLILIAFNGTFLFLALFFILFNLVLSKIFSKRIYEYFAGFSGLNSLITTAISISKISNDSPVNEISFLKQKTNLLTSLKKELGYLVINKESLNELAVVFIEYLNMFLLFDLIAYYRSVNVLLKNQSEIHKVFESVAGLDANISVASYLEEIPVHSNPVFTDSDSISFKNIYHPLLNDAVPNTMESFCESVLITGSNMAGKTTFIKTVGINLILAQTLYLNLAEYLQIPKLKVKTAIRRNDDLHEGKSYFFVEIEEINNFLKLSENENKYLFLIDEIFRGTNTIERLAASASVLKYLSKTNKVFVTTHDIELQGLLENSFKMFHFSEQVEGDKYFFNYKLKEGPCKSGNAIKLLELMDYPDTIVKEANNIVKELLRNSSI